MNSQINTSTIAECKDTSEKIDLYESCGLYIKPIARLNITIQLPPTKTPGQSVSNSEIIDKLKKQSLPEEFIYLRIIKSTLEFIRLEGEIENKSAFKTLLSKLDNSTIKMNSFTDVLKVRAAEAKISYPTRHDWESFFKDIQNPTDELRPGERPDTLHLSDVPCKWFAERKSYSGIDIYNDISNIKPSENVLKEVFSIFGELRMIDIPLLSNPSSVSSLKKPYTSLDLLSQGSTANLNLSTFEAFIQYKDYISFVKAMDAFRGMKLLYIDENKSAFTANIKVDFDRTKHLSDKEIKKREIDKLKAIEIEKIKNAQFEKEKEKEAKQKEIANFRLLLEESISENSGDKKNNVDEKSKEQRRREREEIRRQKRITKKQQEEEKKLDMKIALEERKILIAQRKLESMRLLEELFNRVKVIVAQEELEKRQKELEEVKRKKLIEDENQENIKKMKTDEENQEQKAESSKVNEQPEESDVQNEDDEFELRKNINNVSTHSPENTSSHNYLTAMPRAILLSNVQLQQPLLSKKPNLYDEDDIAISENSQNFQNLENIVNENDLEKHENKISILNNEQNLNEEINDTKNLDEKVIAE